MADLHVTCPLMCCMVRVTFTLALSFLQTVFLLPDICESQAVEHTWKGLLGRSLFEGDGVTHAGISHSLDAG